MDAEYPAAHLKFVNLTVPSQGYLKMPNGRALTGQSHDYIRHGVTTLFAAFDIATGKVTGPPVQAAPARRVSRLHEPCRRPT
jgi:hypothetical protein